jgi:pSer/pThr/pTyr-binding forkhead associated (FHA) protein
VPKVILQFEDQTLKDYALGSRLTIGRLPDNTVIIDNPAVSGHHACIVREADHFILEDLRSRNGTFVNEKQVHRHTLQNGDVVLVGKHQLRFDEMADGEAAAAHDESTLPNLGDTVYLTTQKHKEMLTKLRATTAPVGSVAKTTRVALLRVLSGRADQEEYRLEARTSLIGKSQDALVRLQGWFKPRVAIAIGRNGEGYVATPSGGKTLINNELLRVRHTLKDGDVLQVCGLTLEFRTK